MSKKPHHRERELRRDEVFVAPGHVLPGEWERNNSFFTYRLIKRTGWAGKLLVVLYLLMIFGGIFSLSDQLAVGAIAAAVLVFAIVVVWAYRRRH